MFWPFLIFYNKKYKNLNLNIMNLISDKWMTIKDYAMKHCITVAAVHKRIKTGRLKAKKLGNLYIVKYD